MKESGIPSNHMVYFYHYLIEDQFKDFIHKVSMNAIKASQIQREALNSYEDIVQRQEQIRKVFRESIGSCPQDAPLNSKVTGSISCDDYRIEKVIFQAREREFVTGNLYLPEGLTSPTGAVLFLCGHAKEPKSFPEYQRVCRYLAKAGLIAFLIDPIGQGERLSYYDKETGTVTVRDGSFEHDYAGAQSLLVGRSLASYFLHDAMRAVDYLCTRPEVDSKRIGVTGNSGGGTQTVLMMMGDPRIAAAAPATYITARRRYLPLGEAQCMEQIWPGFTAAGMDFADMLIAMAPKPVLVLAAKYDFFPIEGTRETFAEAKRIWKLLGEEDRLELFEDSVPHMYSASMAQRAADFFSRHLNGRPADVRGVEDAPLENALLRCTDAGQVNAEWADARTIWHNSADLAKQLRIKRVDLPCNEKISWLKEKIYLGRYACDTNLRLIDEAEDHGFYFRYLLWCSQEDLYGYGILIQEAEHKNDKLPLTIAVWEGGTRKLEEHMGWVRQVCGEGRCVLVLDVSGTGVQDPGGLRGSFERTESFGTDAYGQSYYLFLSLLWLGDSLPALRAYDVVRCLDALEDFEGVDKNYIHLYGCGKFGLYAGLASRVDERVKGFEWTAPMKDYESLAIARYYDFERMAEILLPNVLEHFDLQEIL